MFMFLFIFIIYIYYLCFYLSLFIIIKKNIYLSLFIFIIYVYYLCFYLCLLYINLQLIIKTIIEIINNKIANLTNNM